MLYFVTINSVLFNLLTFRVCGSCFRTLAAILVSDFVFHDATARSLRFRQTNKKKEKKKKKRKQKRNQKRRRRATDAQSEQI